MLLIESQIIFLSEVAGRGKDTMQSEVVRDSQSKSEIIRVSQSKSEMVRVGFGLVVIT